MKLEVDVGRRITEETGGQEAGRLTFIQRAEEISNMASTVCVWQMSAGRACSHFNSNQPFSN